MRVVFRNGLHCWRASSPFFNRLLARDDLTAEIARQLEEDKPVWENKTYLERPMLCDGDGPVAPFRKWCKEFYPDWYKEQAGAEYEGRREPTLPPTLAQRRALAAGRSAAAE
jgi:hypothetical protein